MREGDDARSDRGDALDREVGGVVQHAVKVIGAAHVVRKEKRKTVENGDHLSWVWGKGRRVMRKLYLRDDGDL